MLSAWLFCSRDRRRCPVLAVQGLRRPPEPPASTDAPASMATSAGRIGQTFSRPRDAVLPARSPSVRLCFQVILEASPDGPFLAPAHAGDKRAQHPEHAARL